MAAHLCQKKTHTMENNSGLIDQKLLFLMKVKMISAGCFIDLNCYFFYLYFGQILLLVPFISVNCNHSPSLKGEQGNIHFDCQKPRNNVLTTQTTQMPSILCT